MGKFDGILILSDLDGTFIAKDGTVPESNLKAIEYFKDNGGKFSFSTGRMHGPVMNGVPGAEKIANALGIMVNGAYLYDFQQSKALCNVFLDKNLAYECSCFAGDFDKTLGIRFSTDRGIVIGRLDSYIQSELTPKALTDHPIFLYRSEWDGRGIYKVVIRGAYEKLLPLRKALEERYSDKLEIVMSDKTYLEFQVKGCTKGSGVKSIRKFYKEKQGIDLKIYAVGDFENDIPMLREADVAVCPQNACDSVKEISSLHLCHCDDGVIADLVKSI